MAVMEKQLISLAQDTVDRQDIDKLIGWLQTYPRLTKGPVTTEFEHKWAKKFGSKYAVYVNSGSSANLMMLYALIVAEKLRNKKILVPALSWATDLAPVIQLGLEPILIDCNLQDLSVDIDHLRVMIAKHQPSALLLVSVLGFSPNMDEIVKVCNETGVILLEDNCESLGTSFNNTLLGNFGLMSSFSLYFGHHLSTIEGGIIMTNDE
jgi:CDP-6-deoxy-D-xylo-4-hexulose-3-dehydrase